MPTLKSPIVSRLRPMRPGSEEGRVVGRAGVAGALARDRDELRSRRPVSSPARSGAPAGRSGPPPGPGPSGRRSPSAGSRPRPTRAGRRSRRGASGPRPPSAGSVDDLDGSVGEGLGEPLSVRGRRRPARTETRVSAGARARAEDDAEAEEHEHGEEEGPEHGHPVAAEELPFHAELLARPMFISVPQAPAGAVEEDVLERRAAHVDLLEGDALRPRRGRGVAGSRALGSCVGISQRSPRTSTLLAEAGGERGGERAPRAPNASSTTLGISRLLDQAERRARREDACRDP